jgi:hypothetical protein
MSIEHKPVSPLRQRMIEDMRLRKLAEKTQCRTPDMRFLTD